MSLALLVATSCGPEVARLDLSEAPSGLAVLVRLDAAGAPASLSAPFGLDAGALTHGRRPELRGDGDTTVVVVARRSWLAEAYPGVDVGALDAAAVELGEPLAGPVRIATDDALRLRVRLALEPDAVWAAGVDGVRAAPEWVGQLAVELEVDAEPCLDRARSKLTAFADRLDPVAQPGLPPTAGLRALDWFEDDRAIVAGPALYLVERGRAYDPAAPGRLILPEALLEGDVVGFTDVAVGPRVDAEGRRRVLVSGFADGRGFVYELTVGVQEGLRAVGTSTVVERPLWSVQIDEDGTVVSVGHDGFVLFGSAERAVERRLPLERLAPPPDETIRAVFTGDRAEPVVVASQSRLHGLDPETETWTVYSIPLDIGGNRFRGLGARDGVVWAGGTQNHVYRRTASRVAFERVELVMPPRLFPCASGPSTPAEPEILRNVHELGITPRDVVLAYSRCTALTLVRRADHCVSVLERVDAPVGLVEGGEDYEALEVRGSSILVLDARGNLLVSDG